MLDVLIIGAGVAGASAARTLYGSGLTTLVVDKARGPGGRASTRRHHDTSFDHGAQYFTARDNRFRSVVADWLTRGVVAQWPGRLVTIEQPGEFKTANAQDVHQRMVGVPGMNAIVQDLLPDSSAVFRQRVDALQFDGGRWQIGFANGASHEARSLICTAPPEQAAALLPSHQAAASIAAVKMRPCWALMVAFEAALDIDFDAAFVNAGPLSWVANNSSKPSRGDRDCWLIHAGDAWSQAHLEDDADTVGSLLLDEFACALGIETLPRVRRATAHRWRYSQAKEPLDAGCLIDPDLHLAVAGDWCAGSRVEGAFLSGLQAATRVAGWRI